MGLKQALPREATRGVLASMGVDEDQTEWLLNLAWATGQSRYRTTLIHYTGDDTYALVTLNPDDANRVIRDSIYAGESCLHCKRAHNLTRIVINVLGFCAYGHYEHGNYAAYPPHPTERTKATFTPSGPQPTLGPVDIHNPRANLSMTLGPAEPAFPREAAPVPAPVPMCAQCGGDLYKPLDLSLGFPAEENGFAHFDTGNDDHTPVLTSRAPIAGVQP